MQIGILEGDSFSVNAINTLQKLGRVDIYNGNDLDQFLSDKEAIFIRLAYKIKKNFLDKAPRLRYLCSPTTGHNHIDTQILDERVIKLISLRGEQSFLANIRATPEHTLGLMIALLRNYKLAFRSTARSNWDRDPYRGQELFKNSVGLIGYGRVGQVLAKYLDTMGASTYYYDPKSPVDYGAAINCKDIDEVIQKSDVIVVCASYFENQKPIITKKHLDKMTGKYLINTARGELIDEKSLIQLTGKDHFSDLQHHKFLEPEP